MTENTEIIRQRLFKTENYLGDFDPDKQGGYDQLDQCSLFGCVWESKIDDNETAPAVWDGGDTITPNTQDWKQVSGDYEAWLMNKDKPAQSVEYPFNGMGRVKLKKHLVEVEVDGQTVTKNLLYQDDFYKGEVGSRVPNINTVFVIQYDFTLGEDITVPENCVLEFDGGSISGGTLTGNHTKLSYKGVIFRNITLLGTFDCDYYSAEMIDVSNLNDVQSLINLATSYVNQETILDLAGKTIQIGSTPLVLNVESNTYNHGDDYAARNIFIIQNGTFELDKDAADNGVFTSTYQDPDKPYEPLNADITFKDIHFKSSVVSAGTRHCFKECEWMRVRFENCKFNDVALISTTSKRIQSWHLESCTIQRCPITFIECIYEHYSIFDMSISECFIEASIPLLIDAYRPEGLSLINNVIETGGSVLQCRNGHRGVIIEANWFEGITGYIFNDTDCVRFNKGLTITGNYISLESANGSVIRLQKEVDYKIENNATIAPANSGVINYILFDNSISYNAQNAAISLASSGQDGDNNYYSDIYLVPGFYLVTYDFNHTSMLCVSKYEAKIVLSIDSNIDDILGVSVLEQKRIQENGQGNAIYIDDNPDAGVGTEPIASNIRITRKDGNNYLIRVKAISCDTYMLDSYCRNSF